MRHTLSVSARLVLVLLACASRVNALSQGAAGADFLKISNGVRAVGMGSSFAAVGEDVYALYWNPAGIANLQAPESAFSYVKLFESNQIQGVYLLTGVLEIPQFPFSVGNSAAGFMALTTGAFDSTDPQALVHAASGSASDILAFVSYSAPVSEALSLGGSVKFIRRSLTGADPTSFVVDPVTGDSIPTRSVDFSAGGLGADAGVLWENLDRTLSLGGSIQNMGEIGAFGQGFGINFGSGAETLPMTFRLGSAIRTELWGQKLLATGDLTSFIDSLGRPKLSLGAEYSLSGIVFLRAGWDQPLDQPIGKTALDFGATSGLASLPSPLRTGLGFRWRASPTTMLQLDYALAPFGTLGSVHHLALLVRWNIPKIPRAVTTEAPAAIEKKTAKSAMVIEPKQIKFSQPPKDWKVEITDDRGRVVKTFQGTGLPPKKLDWDGTDERGHVLTDTSRFKFTLKAKDITNKEVKSQQNIVSVSAEPSLKAVAGKPLYPEVVFALPQGNYKVWQLSIQDGNRLVRTWQGQGTPDNPLKWDGKDANGNTVKLATPRYKWQFEDTEGQKVSGEKALPVVEAEIRPEALGNKVRLIGVRYRGQETALTDDHRAVLEKAARFIAEHPDSALTIEGYADGADGDEANYALAKMRAEKVLQALVEEYDLAAARVTMRVYGRSKVPPMYPNIPEAEQRQRVDLVINVRH